MPLNEIAEFEKTNDIGVCVFVPNPATKIKCIRCCNLSFKKYVDLLLLKGVDEKDEKAFKLGDLSTPKQLVTHYHWVLITDFSSFVGRKGVARGDYCRLCLKRCLTTMQYHLERCRIVHEAKYSFPKDDRFIFKKKYMVLEPAFRGFFDFECISIKANNTNNKMGRGNTLKTKVISDFQVCAYGLVIFGPGNVIFYQDFYLGKDAIERFIELIVELGKAIKQHLLTNQIPLQVKDEDRVRFTEATQCPYCLRYFNSTKVKKCFHHLHDRPAPIEIICLDCNPLIQESRQLRLLCHNPSGFDHHFILKNLRSWHLKKIKAIPKNTEKFLGFVFDNSVRLMDSYLFLTYPLQQLAERLVDKNAKYSVNSQEGGECSSFTPLIEGMKRFELLKNYCSKWKLLTKKGFFPYSWLDCHEKLENDSLPHIENVYNDLRDEPLSVE